MGFRQSDREPTETELASSSVDSTSDTKVENPSSKFISASYAGPDTNGSSSQRYSRRKALKKMRLNNDRKIISYLRRRFRERADPWMDDETIESDSQGDKTYKFKPRSHTHSLQKLEPEPSKVYGEMERQDAEDEH
nr:uncharacterized protein LOC129263228 [Lytechinus pictus]